MVSHAVWKTWPEGFSRQKPRPKTEVFVVTEARGFSHGMGDPDQILQHIGLFTSYALEQGPHPIYSDKMQVLCSSHNIH